MTQHLIVAVLVIVASLVSVWKLMPARRRLATLLALDRWLQRRGWLGAWRERKLGPRIRAAGAGCAGCASNVETRSPTPPRR
jgi:hypothetical protein